MTREDAIYWIKNLAVLSTEKDMPQIEEALNMAIEALADRKTESDSEIPNNCDKYRCYKCWWWDYDHGCQTLYKCKYKPLDKDINVRSKTENNSEKPNNCEDAYPCETCRHNKLEWYSEICDSCCGNNNHYEPKDEPQYDAEEVAKDINRRVEMIKKEWDIRHTETNVETMSCEECKHYVYQLGCTHHGNCAYEPKDEPQYEMGMGTLICDNCSEYGSFKCTKCDGEMYFKRLEPNSEPQTEPDGKE